MEKTEEKENVSQEPKADETPSLNDEKQTKPLKPVKRARTAYFIFAEEKRPEVQKQHPGEGVAAVARALGQIWTNMPAEEKQLYQSKAAAERERVAKELQAWLDAGGKVPEPEANLSHTKRDPSHLIYPINRIRKICKLDPDVRGLSKEATLLITKASELFTCKLGKESVMIAQIQNRRKLLPDDIAQVCSTRDLFVFLREDVQDFVKNQKMESEGEKKKKKDAEDKVAIAAGNKTLNSYFTAKD